MQADRLGLKAFYEQQLAVKVEEVRGSQDASVKRQVEREVAAATKAMAEQVCGPSSLPARLPAWEGVAACRTGA